MYSHDVDQDTDSSSDQHDGRIDFVLLTDQSFNSDVDQDPSDDPNQEDRCKCTDNFCSVPSKVVLFGCWSRCQPDGEQADQKAG